MTAFRSFHKSEIGIAFPFTSYTFTVSSKFLVSSLTEGGDSETAEAMTWLGRRGESFNVLFQ